MDARKRGRGDTARCPANNPRFFAVARKRLYHIQQRFLLYFIPNADLAKFPNTKGMLFVKIRAIGLRVAVIWVAWSAGSVPTEAQTPIPPLPADLLFTASLTAGPGDFPRDVIVRVDAETLEVSPFYVDDEAFEILPLGWSPQGDLLAIYRMMPPLDKAYTLFPRQLCILSRDGVLQRCMNDSSPMHWGRQPQTGMEYWNFFFPITWGVNGQTVYFSTEYPNEKSAFGYGQRLVEASVITGETLRVIYDYPDPLARFRHRHI